jgi:transglutaminase-like putative cysteine protease
LVSNRSDVSDLTYTVGSRQPPTTLTTAQVDGTNAPLPAEMRGYTRLPADFPADVRNTALAITAGAGTPYDRARALEQFFLDPAQGFHYSLDVDLGPDAQSQNAISQFLQSRTGFCVQFASSFTAMARAAGLPARVAVGYTPGRYDTISNLYRVTSEDAHAWGEVWLAGVGWTRFEPTPDSDLPGGSRLPGGARVTTPSAPTTPTPATSTPVGSAPSTSAAPAPRGTAQVDIDAPAAGRGRGGFTFDWKIAMALLAGAIVGAAGVAVAIILAKRRRRGRRRDDPDPATAITGAWEEVLDRLGEAGVERQPARTPLELAELAPARVPDAAGAPLRHLAESYSAARYGSVTPDAEVAKQAWRDASSVSAALRAGASVRERWRRRLDPTPLRR